MLGRTASPRSSEPELHFSAFPSQGCWFPPAMSLIINSEVIPPELLQEEFQAIKSHYERMGAMSCCERDPEFREYAKENVIARVLLNQAAEKQFPTIADSAISETINKLLEEHGGEASVCERLGVSSLQDPLLLQDIVSGLRMDQMLNHIWGEISPPSDQELQAFQEQHRDSYLTDERVRALAIFKQVEKVEDRDNVYNLLRKLRREALAGADFEAMATEHTDKEDKVIDLGWFKRGDFMDEFDLIFFSLLVDEISPVFASHWGFHLAKIIGHEPAVLKDFESVKAEVTEHYMQDQKQARTKAFIEDLKAKATIEAE